MKANQARIIIPACNGSQRQKEMLRETNRFNNPGRGIPLYRCCTVPRITKTARKR